MEGDFIAQDKKRQILIAAKECFAKFGYKKTTLDDIGSLIGLNKASIYYYFKNKEEIFTTIILNEFEEFISKLQQEIEGKKDCDQKILTYFVQKLSFWSQNSSIISQITEIEPEKIQLLVSTGEELYHKIEHGEKSFLSKILAKCISDGHIQDCDTNKMSELMFSLVNGVKDRYLGFNKNKKLDPNGYENMLNDVQTALKIFLKGLKSG